MTFKIKDGLAIGTVTVLNNSGVLQVGAPNLLNGATGSIPYQTGSSATTFLAGNTTTTPNFYTSTGTGSAAQAPILTSSTGSGSVVLATSPSLTSPTLGVATATSINGLTVSTTTGTLTLANSSTLATSGAYSVTFTATGTTALTLPTSGTITALGNTVTGSGNIVLATTPTFGTSIAISGSTSGTITFSSGTTPSNQSYTLPSAYPSVSGYVLSSTTGGVMSWAAAASGMVYPSTGIPNSTGSAWGTSYSTSGSGTVVALATGPTLSAIASLGLRDTAAAFDLTIASTSSTTLTAGRILTIDVVNAARTLTLGGNLSIGANFTTDTNTISFATTAATSLTLPTSGTLATQSYVDATTVGLNVHEAVRIFADSTNTDITDAGYTAGTGDQNSGFGIDAKLTDATSGTVLVIDGVTVALTDRVLVNAFTGANSKYNGIYTLTTVGATGTTKWVLTRATDYNNSVVNAVTAGDFFFVHSGTTYAATGWVQTKSGTNPGPRYTIKIGTDAINFTQFSGTGTYLAGTGLTLTGTSFSVNASQTQITAVGTLTGGTWNASLIGATYGGTGVNNGSNTITLGGSLTTSGAFATTLTVTNNTNVTLPTTGTLLTTAGSGSSLTFGTGSLALSSNLTTTGAFTTSLTQSANVTLALPGANGTLATLAGTEVFSNKTFSNAITRASGATNIATDTVVQSTLATTTATSVDSWAFAAYRSAKYLVQITQGSTYQISEILVIHNGTTTTMTEYGAVETDGALATFTSSIVSTNAVLTITMASATSATINMVRTLILV